MPAKLPEQQEEQTISRMPKESQGWTVPWGMSVALNGDCYLNSAYSIHDTPGGTVAMLVRRDKQGDYHVDISRCRDHRWNKMQYQKNTWFAIPVESIKQ